MQKHQNSGLNFPLPKNPHKKHPRQYQKRQIRPNHPYIQIQSARQKKDEYHGWQQNHSQNIHPFIRLIHYHRIQECQQAEDGRQDDRMYGSIPGKPLNKDQLVGRLGDENRLATAPFQVAEEKT